MDTVAITSVVSSASVALATLASNAWLKRGDRKHERTLDREGRVWEAKSAALIAVISMCNRLLGFCEFDWSQDGDDVSTAAVRRCVAVLKAVEQMWSNMPVDSPELIAYASESVRRPASLLSKIVHDQMREQYSNLIDLQELREQKESAVDREDMHAAAELRDRERMTEVMIAGTATLSVDEVQRLCRTIINAARRDLGAT